MESENTYNNEIPTIRQILQQLQLSYEMLERSLDDAWVIPLIESDDLENRQIGIKKVLNKIPDEQTLENIYERSNPHWIPQAMKNYEGNYKLIMDACKNFPHLKKEQKKLYYIAAQLELPSVSNEFKQLSDKGKEKLATLHSYHQVAINKKNCVHRLQKNTISQQYFENLLGDFEKIHFQDQSKFIHRYQKLINICYYDSHNGEKQYQFVCLGEQNLKELVDQFDCMILQLQPYYRQSKTDKPLIFHSQVIENRKIRLINENKRQQQEMQIILIDEPYQSSLDPYNNSSKKDQQPLENEHQFILINSCIYYSGEKTEIERMLINQGPHKRDSWQFYPLQNTQINDLRVEFGHPYIYSHLNGCDHIIIFKQARLFMGNLDSNFQMLDKAKYPFKVYESKMKRKKCDGCGERFADMVSICDALKSYQNLYLCKDCHKDLHYDENGDLKVSDTKFIPYIHD